MRHEEYLGENPRMGLQLYNLRRIDEEEQKVIRRRATRMRAQIVAA
jgi:deoxyribodipyrimidine photolyase-like uncharacterized protein